MTFNWYGETSIMQKETMKAFFSISRWIQWPLKNDKVWRKITRDCNLEIDESQSPKVILLTLHELER